MGMEAIAGLALTVVITVAGWVWNLSGRMAAQDSKLEAHEERVKAAETIAAGASARAIDIGRELAVHREHVAAEYVSRDAMDDVTNAINRLGDRLDKLFIELMSRRGPIV